MTKKKTSIKKPVESKAVPLPEIFDAATASANADKAAEVLNQFPPGMFTGSIHAHLRQGEPDIRSLLYYLAATYKPAAYLEIGVRLGYSLAMVASASPSTSIAGVDMWVANYAGEKQAGFVAVEKQIRALGCENPILFLNGNSHVILPQRFSDHPKETYGLILVDADHTKEGALSDLRACLPQLTPGGFLVFDDLHDPALRAAWEQIQEERPEIEYYGRGVVGLARKG